jgi:hypothetical protein
MGQDGFQVEGVPGGDPFEGKSCGVGFGSHAIDDISRPSCRSWEKTSSGEGAAILRFTDFLPCYLAELVSESRLNFCGKLESSCAKGRSGHEGVRESSPIPGEKRS